MLNINEIKEIENDDDASAVINIFKLVYFTIK